MRAVAEWLIIALTAAAKTDNGPAGDIEGLTALVDDLELTLDPQRAIVIDGDPGRHLFPF